ncbi:2-methylcitrate dehydratase [Sulfitobacter alexandrii]|uniref:2-methylcitrate dehydratase n=1 Tax=Sulfitobacter alexandrii TaxID=1917485 RepID=A0A1J0WG78_9RHOB|nr:MmgE/PrpD family protein [Sulfitobacter alexandrii]APE43314.1 2-methylcitrate dehydratase [Sulfitobacter alexandrii]
MKTVTDQLIRFRKAEVPAEAAVMMRLSLFDWAACGIAGAQAGTFDDFAAAQRAMGTGQAQIFGGGSATAPSAALVNGTLSHALDYDDTHFAHIGHPSVAVLPAVIALAEELSAPLDDVVLAATLGVEASILVGLWLGRSHYQVGYHQTATAGAFGAVMGCARLLELDKRQLRAALGLCASMASGLKAQFGTMAKPLNAGLAARTGVEAALWAQAGMTAAEDGLAGPLGFGPTHHGEAAEVTLPRGTWRITEISHKFHACCHGLHAMLEAVREATLDPDTVESIHIRTSPRWMSVCNIETPATGLEAKFSYTQTCAMALLGHDTGAIASFTDDVTKDADIVALRARIRVSEEARLSETQSEVAVSLAGGAMRRLKHDLSAPLSLETRAAKLQDKAVALLGEDRAEALWQAAQGDDLRALMDQLVRS